MSIRPPAKQEGFVLVTAVIFLMVLSLLGVMAVRGSLFEERSAANERDLSLARESAELALRDAERDILGIRFDGQFCAAGLCALLRPAGTRPVNAAEAATFWSARNDALTDPITPIALQDGGLSLTPENRGVYAVDMTGSACGINAVTGIARPLWSGANWGSNTASNPCNGTITQAVPTIQYGTFTNAPVTSFAPANAQGSRPPRYMIEMFTPDDLKIRNTSAKIFFRITAVGFGRTAGSGNALTSVTLQSVFSPL
ncbi:PilX N-terminal domain-containing pilus assembly protein [Polaromonas sp.]|uniref:pilus assembly PilX family protein n=1 Tax=Polaromonas sp. TaxID=1869339 RepID=UPI0013BA245A|nr:PilX N-terminal domain-containing pilus assembly protein [Polaromonas sp.]NDP64265.1 hypothetical protein [Polaromonas sp.]